ncbi:MAG: metal-dependent transcriptional regulator [Planctomycetaceae bacterium]|nr:metal-dependent transcriptional regulator [Planctomycetaceae bacterium]
MTTPSVEELMESLYEWQFEKDEYPAATLIEPALAEATAAGYVVCTDGQCRLTDTGEAAGRDVVRRHRLAECLLRNVLASPDVDADACRFEHLLLNGLDDRICALLGHPRTCPHGKPIPQGACCRAAAEETFAEVRALCDGRPGESGTVAYLTTRDNRQVQKLMAMGVLPGADVHLIRRFPSYVFQVGYSQFTVDHELAQIIYVHWSQPSPQRRKRRRWWGW